MIGDAEQLKWQKTKVSESLDSQIEDGLATLNQRTGQNFRRITHLFGRIFTCQAGRLLFFTAGDGKRPPQIVVVAKSIPENRTYFPGLYNHDFEECCCILGIQVGSADSERFRNFVMRP